MKGGLGSCAVWAISAIGLRMLWPAQDGYSQWSCAALLAPWLRPVGMRAGGSHADRGFPGCRVVICLVRFGNSMCVLQALPSSCFTVILTRWHALPRFIVYPNVNTRAAVLCVNRQMHACGGEDGGHVVYACLGCVEGPLCSCGGTSRCGHWLRRITQNYADCIPQ